MANDGVFLRVFARTSSRNTPVVALVCSLAVLKRQWQRRLKGAGAEALLWGAALMLRGAPVYWTMRWQRSRAQSRTEIADCDGLAGKGPVDAPG